MRWGLGEDWVRITDLLGVQPKVVDQVALDRVEPRLIPSGAVDPHSLAGQSNTVLTNVPHLVGGDQRFPVVGVQPDAIPANAVKQAVVLSDAHAMDQSSAAGMNNTMPWSTCDLQ